MSKIFKNYFIFYTFIFLISSFFILPNFANAVNYCTCTKMEGATDVPLGCQETFGCNKLGGTCGKSCTPPAASKSSASTPPKSGYLGSSGIAQYIPDCSKIKDQCSDISVFLITAIGIGQYVFGIIGALALVMFVYGGIILITASGNPEKVKQGMGIFMSAVIGLVIVFSAYMLVKYFGRSILNIGSEYQLK